MSKPVNTLARSKWLNIIFFNLLWLGCVAGGNALLWLTGPAVICYLWLLITTQVVTLRHLLLPAGIGIAVDALLTATGLFDFSNCQGCSGWPIPLWLMVLWLAFVSTLTLSLEFIGKNKVLAVLAGAIGFPLSYAMGERLGAVAFSVGLPEALAFLSLLWAVLLPLIFHLVQQPKNHPSSELL